MTSRGMPIWASSRTNVALFGAPQRSKAASSVAAAVLSPALDMFSNHASLTAYGPAR